VLVTAAVLLAAGGGAYAATSNSSSAQARLAAAKAPGRATPKSPFATTRGALFVAGAAVVNADGSIARSSGLRNASNVNVAPGEYDVVFNRKVNRCAYQTTLGAGLFPPDGQIGVAPEAGHKNGVFVTTYNSGGSLANEGFHIIIVC
jgi:hypothetical protein